MTTRRELLGGLAAAAFLAIGGVASARSRRKPPNPRVEWKKTLLARRKEQITRVAAYADAGVFPANRTFKGKRIPFFVDADGNACAVAHLMIQDGLGDEVAKIAAANNHVRVMDVPASEGGAMIAWVLGSGLMQEEAALIQPSYDWERPERDFAAEERERIQRHLAQVIGKISADTDQSIEVALDRLLQSTKRPSRKNQPKKPIKKA